MTCPIHVSRACAADALTVRILEADTKLIVVGAGPAGLTAAIYAARVRPSANTRHHHPTRTPPVPD